MFFSSLPYLPRSFYLPISTKFMFSLSISPCFSVLSLSTLPKTNIKKHQNKQTKKYNKRKKSQTKQNDLCHTPKQQSKANQTHGVHFLLAKYSWTWYLSWSVADIPNNNPVEFYFFLAQ